MIAYEVRTMLLGGLTPRWTEIAGTDNLTVRLCNVEDERIAESRLIQGALRRKLVRLGENHEASSSLMRRRMLLSFPANQ
jgi:hypothetical protein